MKMFGCAIQPKETLLALIQYFSENKHRVCTIHIFLQNFRPPPLPPPKLSIFTDHIYPSSAINGC